MSQRNVADDPVSMQLLTQLFTAATQDASAAMSQWTSGQITLSLDEVLELPLEEVCGDMDCGQELLTMVVLTLDGEVGGDMILTFDEQNGRQLAALLLGREVETTPDWTALEMSALQETGNILGCAYMNTLTRLIGVDLIPSPPYFLQDYGACVLEQALMAQAMNSDRVLICRTRFHQAGDELNWNVFFVPSTSMRSAMEHAWQQE
jgi:chemotaxis protein CheC